MKKTLFIIALALISVVTFSQEKPIEKKTVTNDKKEVTTIHQSDTVTVAGTAKFIKIGDKVWPAEAFSKNVPVFLTTEVWYAILEIINTREYGKNPSTLITQILQAIAQQLPKKE